ncbi:MAG TPA: hypothetical protein PKD53_20655 [Chloroflexaceae bacterium]|nr:hypothetical protein [Chloroflexaceae bacterium]
METLAFALRYGFVVVLAVAFIMIGLALFQLAREKARAAAPPPPPAEE